MGQPANGPTPPKARLLGLDLLRLLAVVLVLGRHMPPPPDWWPTGLRLPFLLWIRGGWVGVDLFFVLSGFLVSGLLFTEFKARGRLGVGRFYTRRGWKIYPPFFALIAVTVAVGVFREESMPWAGLASEVFFLQSYWPGLWNHTWSLAVEEHFYVLLPLMLALILRCSRGSKTPLRPILLVAAIAAAATLLLRILNWQMRPTYSYLTHHFATHLRLDSLLFGVAIAYAYHFHSDSFTKRLTPWRIPLVLGGAMLLLPAFVFDLESTPFLYTFGFSLFYIGSGMMLVGILLSEMPRRGPALLLAALGAYSYSIYLWHMPVLHWGVPLLEWASGGPVHVAARIAAYIGGSFCFGIVMAKLVELPVLRLRDRLFPSRSPGAVAVGSRQVTPS